MPPTLFPKVPIEYCPDPRFPWNPIYLGEAVPGPARIEQDESGARHLTTDFGLPGGLRKERLGLRRWWRYVQIEKARRCRSAS